MPRIQIGGAGSSSASLPGSNGANSGELDKAEEVLGMVLPADEDATLRREYIRCPKNTLAAGSEPSTI